MPLLPLPECLFSDVPHFNPHVSFSFLAVSPISPFLISSKLSGFGWLCGEFGNPNLGDFQHMQLLTRLIAAPTCPIDGLGRVGE
jgi:hypothetical protein